MQDKDIIIIGAGPAGITAGIYATRAELDTLVIETMLPGGQMATATKVKNYPGFPEGIGGMELTELMKSHAENIGVNFKTLDEVKKVEKKKNRFVVTTASGKYGAKTVIVATGLSRKKLGVPGEREFRGRGVSYCATCDGQFFKDRRVVVVGSGTHAVTEALYLNDIAGEIKLVMEEERPVITTKRTEKILKESKIEIVPNTKVLEILGNDTVTGLKIEGLKTKKESTIDTDGIFIESGRLPNIAILEGMEVATDEKGYIKVDEKQQTTTPGLYAAGDVTSGKHKQIGIAVGQGTIAALSAREFIKGIK